VGKRPTVDIRAVLEQQFDHVVNVGMVKYSELIHNPDVEPN
jgi:hypothetical protein